MIDRVIDGARNISNFKLDKAKIVQRPGAISRLSRIIHTHPKDLSSPDQYIYIYISERGRREFLSNALVTPIHVFGKRAMKKEMRSDPYQ